MNGINPYSTLSTMARRLFQSSAGTLMLPLSLTTQASAICWLNSVSTCAGTAGKINPAAKASTISAAKAPPVMSREWRKS